MNVFREHVNELKILTFPRFLLYFICRFVSATSATFFADTVFSKKLFFRFLQSKSQNTSNYFF
jgi:hypothetical protein